MEKKPFVTKEQLEKIVEKYPTPFHLYDEKGIRQTARDLYKAFSWNEGFKEYFAVKATPTPAILKILKEEGCGTDCSSLTELMMSDRCGFADGNSIMFSSNETPAEEFILAKKLGAIINLDDITHIDFLKDACGIPERICCRYNPGGYFSLGTDIMDNPGDAKYGMTKPQIFEAFKRLKREGVKEFGIHSFLASNTVSNEYYPALAAILFNLAVELKENLGVHIGFINLSGGVGIPYTPDKEPNDIFAIGEGVRKAYEEILVPAGMGDVKIFTELGRYMLAPHGHLVVKAIHEKHTYKEYIGVDACAANLMRPAMYGAYHHITVMGKENEPCDHTDNPGDAKYGMTKPQIFEAFKRLKREGVKEFGIHSFLASNTVSNEYYPALAAILFNLAVELKENLGVHIGFINLSGGVGIPYTPDKEPNDIFAIGEGVRKAYEEILVPAGMGDVKIFTELGRYMLAPHGHLVVKAIHEKHTYKEYIGVDACAANLMRPAMYGAYHHITVMGKENEPCDHTYDVVGSLCENNDKFAIDRKLPKIDMGDLLVLHDTGAHGFAMGYNYNGRLKSAEILLQEDGSTRMIRRAETPEDYFATIEGFDF